LRARGLVLNQDHARPAIHPTASIIG
jgi:hypothetical protein